MAVRAPLLYRALRCFCLGAFADLARELEDGAEIPYAFEEHGTPGRPSLYEYRPLLARFVEARNERIFAREDTSIALEELAREPAAAVFAGAHAGGVDGERGLFRALLQPLLTSTAEACGGFDWDDAAFDRAYGALERSLFGDRHSYTAVAPLVGVSLASPVELGGGTRVRQAAAGELSTHWPEAKGLLPARFGREPDRTCVLELQCTASRGAARLPDAAGELADAVTAIRLATAGAVAAGPVLFERLDWRPLAVKPVLPIAATRPDGEPARLDAFRARLAGRLLERLALADQDAELGEALDRWELSLFQPGGFRGEQLRAALDALLGDGDGTWAASIRTAVLLGETARERATLFAALRRLAVGERVDRTAEDAVRRALVETLAHGDRRKLIASADDTLLGTRPRPATGLAMHALAG